MPCDRCKDIHKAQLEGKTQNKCECSCHNSNNDGYTGTYTGGNLLLTTDNSAGVDSGIWTNITGNNLLWSNNAGATDATLNYGTCQCCGSYHG